MKLGMNILKHFWCGVCRWLSLEVVGYNITIYMLYLKWPFCGHLWKSKCNSRLIYEYGMQVCDTTMSAMEAECKCDTWVY